MAALDAIISRRSSMASALSKLPAALFRCMSNVPDRPGPQSPAQRMTLTSLRGRHRRGEPITVITAYDYPSTVHLDMAGVDVCLVGDSAAMVVHGHDTTLPISLDEMLVHCRAVARGAEAREAPARRGLPFR